MPDPARFNSEAQSTTGLLASYLNPLLHAALDLIYPPRCSGCGRVDATWCPRCAHDLSLIAYNIYPRRIAEDFVAAATGLHAGLLQQAIHGLKYENVRQVAVPLGGRLAVTLERLGWPVEIVVPVPLGAARLKQRGYNQAELLAQAFALEADLPCLPHALNRQKETQSQVGLNAQQRQENMEEAFVALPEAVAGKIVLIVDDVLTTGATLYACAQAALAAGANSVWGLAVTSASDGS
ncbi:MAG: phosphoribosyltransferase family protein [bacterium]|nr:phosphoribosyltransferase family protein [bacterium]